MQSVPSCELIRRCWWPWSCGLWESCCVSPGFKFITIDPPANSMAPMMYLLHCSCITQGVGIIGGSRLSNLPSTSSSPSLLFAAVSFSLNYSSSSAEHVPNFHSIAMCIKFPFQRVLIHSKRTPDERAMLVLLRHYNLSWRISECVALKDFTLTLCTVVRNWRFLMHWKEYLMELHNLQFSSMVPL